MKFAEVFVTLNVICMYTPIRNILGHSYNANDIINADIENTIHPKFSEFRMKVKQTFLLHNH